jgi:TatD DNase family protein
MSKSKKNKLLKRIYPEPIAGSLPYGVVDNHTHIDLGTNDFVDKIMSPLEILKICRKVGVEKIVQSGTDLESSIYSVDLAKKFPDQVIASIGIHPNEVPSLIADNLFDAQMQEIKNLVIQNLDFVKSIGETGLDYFRTTDKNSQMLQKKGFIKHIELAKEFDLAMQIHDREAHDDILDTLLQIGAPNKTVFHCFSGDVDMAKFCTSKGWYISFAGNITFAANNYLRDALKAIPIENHLVETDAPFLAPLPYRGRPNITYLTANIVQFVAQTLDIDLPALCKQLYKNTQTAYNL